jgi:D-arabinose 1-dehydrogenase-like Zn-dependent alcohol dehydrogenase
LGDKRSNLFENISKEEEAKRLGAGEFYATKDVKDLKIKAPIDNLLVTTSSQPDWGLYLPNMSPSGVISPLSIDSGDFHIPYMPLLTNGLRIQGGIVSSRQVHRDMLDFAAFHKIKPVKMTFPLTLEGVKESLKTLEEGKMRYRGVLVAQ